MKNLINKSICVIISLMMFGCGKGINSGEGRKIGQIVKIGQHGAFCSTYEAEIIRGGLNGGSGVNGLALDFSITDQKLFEQLTEAMEMQQEIELYYQKGFLRGICTGETNYFATGFKVLNARKSEQNKQEDQNDMTNQENQNIKNQNYSSN